MNAMEEGLQEEGIFIIYCPFTDQSIKCKNKVIDLKPRFEIIPVKMHGLYINWTIYYVRLSPSKL